MLKEIYLRIGMATPPLFRRLAAVLVTIGGVCTAALTGQAVLGELSLNVELYPAWARELLQIGAFAGLLGYLIAKLAVVDADALYEKLGQK